MKNFKLLSRSVCGAILLLVLGGILWSGKAQALSFTDMPLILPDNEHQYINLADYKTGNDSGGGADLPKSHLKIYSTNNNSMNLNLYVVDRSIGPAIACRGYTIKMTVFTLDGLQRSSITKTINGCNNTYPFPIAANSLSQALVPADHTYNGSRLFEGFLTLELKSIPDAESSFHSSAFKVSLSGGARLGYVAESEPFASDRSINTYPSNAGSTDTNSANPKDHKIRAKFKPRCDYRFFGQETFIHWNDDDQTQNNQETPLRARLVATNENTGATSNPATQGPFYSGTTGGGVGYIKFIVQPSTRYELIFEDVWGGNGINIYYPFDSNEFYLPCAAGLSASCTLTITTPFIAGTSNGLIGGRGFNIRATITNTGTQPIPEYPFGPTGPRLDLLTSLKGPGSQTQNNLSNFPGGIAARQTVFRYKTFTAPDGINDNITLSGSLRYPGYIDPIARCNSIVLDTYEDFNITPYISIDADNEDPNPITVNSRIEYFIPSGASILARSNRALYYYPASGGGPVPIPVVWNAPFSNNPEDFLYNVPGSGTRLMSGKYDRPPGSPRAFKAGDRICAKMTVNPGGKYVGPNNAIGEPIIARAPPTSPFETCLTVADKPYVRAYGADVAAGGQFDNTPPAGPPGAGFIKAYTRKSSEYGSGVEFAALALKEVEGFASANLRTISPVPRSGLTFASPPPDLGGHFASTRAVTDYYNETRQLDLGQKSIDNINLTAGGLGGADGNQQQWVKPVSGLLKLSDTSQNYDKRHSLYVEGNVVIVDNIIYKKSGPGWSSIGDIPNFTLIVRGNIYIKNSVEQLDGLYVAQPLDDGTRGKIYTCTNDVGAVPAPSNLYAVCNKKLKINGSLIAQDIKFFRTKGTLSERASLPDGTYPKETFFGPNPPGPGTNVEDNAAESINMGPELYLSYPVFKRQGSQSNGKYDYFVSLPPIL